MATMVTRTRLYVTLYAHRMSCVFLYVSGVRCDMAVCSHTTVLLYGNGVVNEPYTYSREAMERVTARACAVSSNTLTALRRPR
jgi:hypothetical protein